MPGMDGPDLATRLMVRHPRLAVLYMSGYPSNIIAQHGALEEGVHFIQKPFARAALASRIREALGT